MDDFVTYEKEECTIVEIKKNPKYFGERPMTESKHLSRLGFYRNSNIEDIDTFSTEELDFDAIFNSPSTDIESQASHCIKLYHHERGQEFTISSSSDIKKLDFAYCTTIHKSQGSEWRKVWVIIHRFHARMLSRELLYTAMTRARERLEVLYSEAPNKNPRFNTINKAIQNQIIPGKHWQDKVEAFKGKLETTDYGDWDK